MHQIDRETAATGSIMTGWISRPDLARELGLSEDTLRRWEAMRRGPPCIRAGRKVFYRRRAIEDWLAAQEQGVAQKRLAGGRR